jgi:hypothetical protein
MRITIKYQSDTFMPYELRAIIEKYKSMICGCCDGNERWDYMDELCKEIECWLAENAESATSPCDNCNDNRIDLCNNSMRFLCYKYKVYERANAKRTPRGINNA